MAAQQMRPEVAREKFRLAKMIEQLGGCAHAAEPEQG
jgi:hypothetical protein